MSCKLRPLTCALLIVQLALLAGCASVELASSWKDPAFAGPAPRNVLVMGVSRTDTNRRLFEDNFSQSLRAAGLGAVPGYTLIPENGAISNDRVRQAVAKAGADAVMVTRVQRVEKHVDVSPSYAPGPYYGGFYSWYGTTWGSAPTVSQYDVFTLETTLWDLKTQKVVWSGTSKVVDPGDMPTLTGELSKVLIEKMRADRVL